MSTTSTVVPTNGPEQLDKAETASAALSQHEEKHSNHSEIVHDVIIGFADGLTVPFALTAGLSSVGSLNLVILGGLAELFAGSISMGLGAYLAALTERTRYEAELARERFEVDNCAEMEEEEIYEIMGSYGLSRDNVQPVVEGLKANKDMWVKFMMDFELKLDKPRKSKAVVAALSMGISYFLGGLVPMIPYFAYKNVNHALFTSIGISVVILLVFGYVKTVVSGASKREGMYGAVQTLLIGVLAAGASYGIVRGFNQIRPVHV